MPRTLIFIASILFFVKTMAGATPVFEGGKTTWHGFDRYDFIMDDQTMAIAPLHSATGRKKMKSKVPPKERTDVSSLVPKRVRAGQSVVLAGLLLELCAAD